MDPVTAVSLAASVVTLGVLVLDCSKTLYTIGKKVKDAPEAVHRLTRQLQTSRDLLATIEGRLNDQDGQAIPSDLQQICKSILDQIGPELEDFKRATAGLLKRLDEPSKSSKKIRLRFHALYKEGTIEEHDRRMTGHHERLKVVLLLINKFVRLLGSIALC